jgi:Tol biopolymer transport system component
VGTHSELQSVSPDGTKAAVIQFDGGQNLAVYDFATRQSKRLTNLDWSASWASYGVWSPDSRQIAYAQAGPGGDSIAEVRTTTLGGDFHTIFRNEANPGAVVLPVDWVPDGRTVVALLGRADGTWAIGLIPATGGPFTPLRSLQWTGGYPDHPRVSPDGRFVAFVDGATGTHDIHVLSLDGRTLAQLTDHPADDRQPVWSADGRYIAFTSTRSGSVALWVVPVKDGKPAGDPTRIKDGMQGVSLMGWIQRGLVYEQLTRTDDIYTLAVDQATNQPTGTPQLLAYGRTGHNTGPVWSPDGRYLALVSRSSTEPDRRYVVLVPEKGGDPREFLIPTTVYSVGQDPYDLRWFGDSSGLGFSGVDSQRRQTVFQLSLASGQWKTLSSPVKTWTRIEWDQTGSRYYYARQGWGSSGEVPAIVERDLQTDQDRVVMVKRAPPNSLSFRGLRVSPNRRSLAFTLEIDATLQLIVADIQSGEARTILEEKTGASPETSVTFGVPAWSPDGRSILITRKVGQAWPELRVVSVADGAVRSLALDKLFAGRSAVGSGDVSPSFGNAVWSPDGARLAFVLSSFRIEDWIMEFVLPSGPSVASGR